MPSGGKRHSRAVRSYIMQVQAFDDFYRQTCDRSLRAVIIATGNATDAADLVAEAYARALARWSQVSAHPAPVAWIVRTAINLERDRLRRLKRRLTPSQAAAAEPELPADPRLVAALAALPLRQRQVVALRVLADLDTAATAQALGISEATVRVHLHRALTALRVQLIGKDLT